jgi:phage terminase large subunit-like protein
MSVTAGYEATVEQIAKLAILRTKMAKKTSDFVPLPHQIPPEGNWRTFLLLAGRGAGKSRAGTEMVMEHLRTYGRRARVGVMAPTNILARSVCAEGDSGILNLYGSEFKKYNRMALEAWHENGGYVSFGGSEMVDNWRGPQWTMLWIDEWCVCDPEAIDNAMMGLRLKADPEGGSPRCIATTTPRPLARLRELIAQPSTVTKKAFMEDNPYIDEGAKADLIARYGGTTLGRQELYAEILDEVDGAFWTASLLDANRVSPEDVAIEDMTQVVVAVDPAVTSGNKADQTGICVAGSITPRDMYVFQLEGGRWTPGSWARRVLDHYLEYQADKIIGEKNNGGDMVKETIEHVYQKMLESGEWEGPPPKIELVWASRGKTTRAEPIVALDEQGAVHHVGIFPEAERQMVVYPVESKTEGDDMVDARVWALACLSGQVVKPRITAPIIMSQKNVWN